MFNRKYIFNPGSFSIAMLDYRSVQTLPGFVWLKCIHPQISKQMIQRLKDVTVCASALGSAG